MVDAAVLSFGAYLLALLSIGIYFFITSETKTLSSYMLADRKAGTWTTAFSTVASFASGFTFFAFVGIGYTSGLSALWYAFFTALLQLFVWRYMGSPFRRLSEKYGSITLVDHLGIHFERRGSQKIGSYIRILGAIIIIVFMSSYLGSQLVSVGTAAEGAFQMNYLLAVVISGLVIAAYTSMGGLQASIWTDYIQGWLMVIAAIGFPVLAIREIGGWSTFVSDVRSIDPMLLEWSGGLTGSELWISLIGFWFLFSFGILGQPHAMQRFQAIKSEKVISEGAVIATTISALRMTFPVIIGLTARVLFEIENPESAMVVGIPELFPGLIAGFLIAGIVSAILSTADSMLLLASADVTRNIYLRYLSSSPSEKTQILVGRGLVIVFALIGIGIAVIQPGTIFEIVAFGFTGLGACFGPVLLLSLYWDGLTGWGTLAGMSTGLIATILHNWYILSEYFPMLVWPVTFGAIFVVSLLTESPEPASEVASEPTISD